MKLHSLERISLTEFFNPRQKLVELLKQDQYTPLSIEDQVVMIFSGVRGYLRSISLSDIASFEEKLLNFVHTKQIVKPFMEVMKDELKAHEDVVAQVLTHFIDNEFTGTNN